MVPDPIDAGHPALDLLNTAGGATRERDVERLGTYADALAFAARVGLVDAAEAAELDRRARIAPAVAAAAVAQLREQREALHAFLVAAVDGDPPRPADRVRVERDVRAAHLVARLSGELEGAAWLVDVDGVGLALVGHRAALATAALLAGPARAQIARCGRCSWLFLDPSPSRRRRWCSMETCGNRAKAARHHARTR